MSFRSVFIALVIGFGLVLAGYLINRQRPAIDTDQPSAAFVKATGKCAECHTRLHYSVVHEYELSVHGKKGINCLECHQQVEGQQKMEHHGFTLSKSLFLRQSERAKKWLQRQEKKRGKGKALGILAAKLGRAVYHVLHKKVAFDEARFWGA